MPKPNEQAQIDFIVDCLRKGEQRKTILGKFGKVWESTSRTTFDRRLNEAKAILHRENKHIQANCEVEVAKEVEARKSKIMTSIERQELLTKIALGEVKIKKPFVISGKIMEYPAEPDYSDRIKAVQELSKMVGDYAPTKQEISITEIPEIIIPGDEKADN